MSKLNPNLFAPTHTQDEPVAGLWSHPAFLGVAALLLLLAGVALGMWLKGSPIPAADSADVGFARDMSEHHRQAVEMATIFYDRTDDETMRSLAYDIMLTQQAQIGIMRGWLDVWGYRWTSTAPKMAWMGMSVTGLMPGMASREELNQLARAEGVEADAIFMQLMIPHHQSGVAMAAAAVDQAETDIVRDLADGMAVAQLSEIKYMQELLQAKGFEPVPDLPSMEMEMEMEMDG